MARRVENETFLIECGLGTLQELNLSNAMIEEIKKEALNELCKTRINDFIIDDGLTWFAKIHQYRIWVGTFDNIDELYRKLD